MSDPEEQDEKEEKRSIIFGMGFDHEDGHKRITEGDNFLLTGGSSHTHDLMLRKVLEFNKILKQKYGKTLEELSFQEYCSIIRSLEGDSVQWHQWTEFYNTYKKYFKKKRF